MAGGGTRPASRYKTSASRDGVRSMLGHRLPGNGKNEIHCTVFTLHVFRRRGRPGIGVPVDTKGRCAACLLRPGFAADDASQAGRVENPPCTGSTGAVRRSTRRREQSTGRETENHLPRLLKSAVSQICATTLIRNNNRFAPGRASQRLNSTLPLADLPEPQVRNASKAWAMRIPTLRTTKNAVIASNMDGSRAINSTKGSAVCTVKKIPLCETNFPPR